MVLLASSMGQRNKHTNVKLEESDTPAEFTGNENFQEEMNRVFNNPLVSFVSLVSHLIAIQNC